MCPPVGEGMYGFLWFDLARKMCSALGPVRPGQQAAPGVTSALNQDAKDLCTRL
jgi:hypothetical protein